MNIVDKNYCILYVILKAVWWDLLCIIDLFVVNKSPLKVQPLRTDFLHCFKRLFGSQILLAQKINYFIIFVKKIEYFRHSSHFR